MALTDTDQKKALGRGLASLIPAIGQRSGGESKPENLTGVTQKDFFLCNIEKIVPNTYQPRKIFSDSAIDELAESIKVHGIIQPLIVRQKDGNYELIAGERRWRAAQRVGLAQVPVVLKDVPSDGASLEMAIIENIQRENLNCIEEAIAYQQLMDEFQLSQEEISDRVGKSRATVGNTLRLLKLPAVIREDITAGTVTMGHARALLALPRAEDQLEVRDLILKKKLSVRETERKVSEFLRRNTDGTEPELPDDLHLRVLEEDLRRIFGLPVRIVGSEARGFIQFSYGTREELMRLSDILKEGHVSTSVGSV